jgi:hypothetical protein
MVFHGSLDHQDLTPLALPAEIKKYKFSIATKFKASALKCTNKHEVPSAVCFMRKKRVMIMSYALD